MDQTINEKDKLSPESAPQKESPEIFAAPESIKETREVVEAPDQHVKIRQQLEKIELDESLKMQVQSHANSATDANTQKTISNLMAIAKDKGVIFAVHVAKKINDPYVLDTFHDALVNEGYYKEFLK